MNLFDKKTVDHFKSNAHKETPEWYISTYNTLVGIATSLDNKEIEGIHNMIHSHLDKKEYNAFMNPFNFKEERHKNIPGKLRNYDIIMKNLRKFIGEYITSYQEFHVISKLPDEDNELLNAANDLAYKLLSKRGLAQIQAATGEANKADMDTNIPAEVSNFKSKWKDNRVINDYNMLEYIKSFTKDTYIYAQAYMHWITYGRYFIEHRVYRNDIEKLIIHPKDAFPIINDSDFVDDYEGFYYNGSKSLTQILSNYGDELSEKDKAYLRDVENAHLRNTTGNSPDAHIIQGLYKHVEGMPSELNNLPDFTNDLSNIEVGTLYYKGFDNIYILKYSDVLGNELEMEVEHDYELNPLIGDISLTSEYIPTVYMQRRFGSKDNGVYTKPIKVEVQRQLLNNSGIVKLPVTGKVNIFPNFPNHSIPKILYPFQITVNLLEMAKERAIITSQGKIGIIPKELMGSNAVEQEEEMYNMLVTKRLFPTMENIPNLGSIVNAIKELNLSDNEYIKLLSDLITITKESAQDAVDMNRQREGNVRSSDGKGANEDALNQVSMGTALVNMVFDFSRCRDYEADIDFTKVAWVDGKKAKFTTTDRQQAFFEINPITHSETEFGVFVTTAFDYDAQQKAIKDYSFALAQNGTVDEDTQLDVITNNNISKLKEILQLSKALRLSREEARFNKEQETLKHQSDNLAETEKAKNDLKRWEIEQNNLKDLLVKAVDLDIKELDMLQSDKDNEVLKNIQERKQELQTQINILKR